MSPSRLAAIVGTVAVAAAVVAGLAVIGSPAEQRLLRLDERRVLDLRRLAQVVSSHWNARQALPSSAPELVDGRLLTRLPRDPSSDEPYEYRVSGQRQFELCAVFDRPSRAEDAADFWYHDAGRRCFEFDVTQAGRY
jgi:hypothetical protein